MYTEKVEEKNCAIAIVDDQEVERRLYEENLTRRYGYDIKSFSSGEELIKWYESGQRTDLVMVDHMMPGGLTGLMTYQQLRSIDRHTPVVMTTISPTHELVRAFLREGGADFIPKPVTDWHMLNLQIRKVIEDNRRRIKVEELIRRNQDLESEQRILKSFCNMVAHELRKPISVICGYAECLQASNDFSQNPENARQMAYVASYSKRLSYFLSSLGYVCDPGKGKGRFKIMPIDAMQLIFSAVRDLRANFIKDTASLSLDAFADAKVMVDPDCFFQVLLNLIDNAIKYAGKKPQVKIVCRECPADNGFIEILVADNGIGIPESELEGIFSHSKRVEELKDVAGNGLGLFISKKIIEMMDGQMWVTSRQGEGSTFGLRLRKAA